MFLSICFTGNIPLPAFAYYRERGNFAEVEQIKRNEGMETTLTTSAELIRQLGYIADDEGALKKALHYVKKLVAQKERENRNAVAEEGALYRPRTKAERIADFNEVCEQVKLARSGKLEGRPLEEVLNEL